MDSPSKLSVIRNPSTFQESDRLCFLAGQRQPRGGSGVIHNLIALTKLLNLQRSGQFPDEPVRIRVGQIHYVTYVMY
jgi:hypothetical protein